MTIEKISNYLKKSDKNKEILFRADEMQLAIQHEMKMLGLTFKTFEKNLEDYIDYNDSYDESRVKEWMAKLGLLKKSLAESQKYFDSEAQYMRGHTK